MYYLDALGGLGEDEVVERHLHASGQCQVGGVGMVLVAQVSGNLVVIKCRVLPVHHAVARRRRGKVVRDGNGKFLRYHILFISGVS